MALLMFYSCNDDHEPLSSSESISISKYETPSRLAFKFPKDNDYKTRYPKFFNYLKDQMPKLYNNKKIVNALERYGSIPSDQVKHHLQFGQGPTIKLMKMDDEHIYGLYNYDIPDTIFINEEYAQDVEKAEGFESDALMFFIGVTILHEYTNYGDFNFNGGQYSEWKKGNAFEREVFGAVITLDRHHDNHKIIYKKQQK